ncbi:MAG: ferrochelatase HemH [Bacteroidetes bacterium HLUCCA01]|nr:MAG: ferrochelatase HemH [Bacteroidetes bacterium HLUCCA01]
MHKPKLGVVVTNLGGPTSEEATREFLYNLFRDEDIIKLGGGKFQTGLASVISKLRYKKIAEKYREINGCPKGCMGSKYCLNRANKVVSDCCSPINPLTELQRRTLEKALGLELPEFQVKVYTAMRYWRPFADQVMNEMMEDGIEHAVLLPLYPHFSWTTTGSSLRDWENVREDFKKEGKEPKWNEYAIKSYHLSQPFLEAVNERIDEGMARFLPEEQAKVHVIFTAHGTPILEVESGDPYTDQIVDTVEAIMDMRDRRENYWISYQSRVGPQKWTQPNTEDLVKRLIDYGIKHFLMVPVAFVTDHIETLHELGIELPEELEEDGYHYDKLEVTGGLNDHPKFIRALVDEVKFRIAHIDVDKHVSSHDDSPAEADEETATTV